MKFLAVLLVVYLSYTLAQTCGDHVCSIDFAENAINCPQDCANICPCVPYCTGRQCGPDGCGGSCGTCSSGGTCNGAGQCLCNRNCIGKECGDDGCNAGNVCDFCGPQQICGSDFRCSGVCTPNCRNPDGTIRVCGNDGCFGSCGECSPVAGQDIRCRNGQCVCRPACDSNTCGPDGCGGTCGNCAGNATCVNGQCSNPIPGCCGDGICGAGEDTCKCHTDCLGCCVNGKCEKNFGETETNCIQDCVTSLLIEVRERQSNLLVTEQCSIAVTGPNSYSATLTYTSPSISWAFQSGGYGTYTFVTTCPDYIGSTQTITITTTTTLVTLLVDLKPIRIEVRDGATNALVSTASITITAQFGSNGVQVYSWSSPSINWTPFIGYGLYQFDTTSAGYLAGRASQTVTITTTLITLYLYKNSLPFIVQDCNGGVAIPGSVIASSTSYPSFASTFQTSGTTTIFTHVGFGNYFFQVSSTGYTSNNFTIAISQNTTQVVVCLSKQAFCGDGVCNAATENASPTSAGRCQDCGRLRGVISLAVGQKDQLVNISIDIWAHPTNPALFLRNGTAVPAPQFSTLSDSKGFFAVQTLSFDAPSSNAGAGLYKRRFYFRLSGQFTDRTNGNDQVTDLLDLWWNYELTNKQWSGSGDLTGTNNSPNFYFYMTPPFTTDTSLIRVILSWGTLISNPSNSLPDLDLVVAGPVDPASITLFGNGIVNFENKDLHSSTKALPYARLVTDSAQGYGPEVMDFYGSGGLSIGFSETYAAGALANAYEVWIDRPNSSPNTDSAFTFLYDTNSFIVVYVNDGTTNDQMLFDARTGVPYAYGFYNRDQWNQVPTTATIWHIIDLSLPANGIVFDGFPGENSTTDPQQPGQKYGYDGQNFETTKQIPCGHVASRGANPAYCPATLTYPQVKK